MPFIIAALLYGVLAALVLTLFPSDEAPIPFES